MSAATLQVESPGEKTATALGLLTGIEAQDQRTQALDIFARTDSLTIGRCYAINDIRLTGTDALEGAAACATAASNYMSNVIYQLTAIPNRGVYTIWRAIEFERSIEPLIRWPREKLQQRQGVFLALSAQRTSTAINAEVIDSDMAIFHRMPIDDHQAVIQMLTRIRELGSYQEGWYGTRGKAPSTSAVKDAEQFVRVLSREKIYPPYISLATDGEMNFLWMLPHFRFDLGFYGDGTYSYYGETSTGDEFLVDEACVSEPLPEQILQLIRKK